MAAELRGRGVGILAGDGAEQTELERGTLDPDDLPAFAEGRYPA
ncbi:MAG TPA: hypothetical protein VGJ13_01840 [Pseudonocardiaceae bacterium]